MLDNKNHKTKIVEILLSIFSDNYLKRKLVFKGGTALMLFYELDRFSTDIDLDLRDVNSFDYKGLENVIKRIVPIVKENKSYYLKTYVAKYKDESANIKIEVNKQKWPLTFDIKDYLGISVPIMSKSKMLSHKLCAITDRKVIQNRDLYDVDFMLENEFEIDDEIIKIRTGKNRDEYLKEILKIIDSKKIRQNILNGLGNVLSNKKREWVKNNLIDDLKIKIAALL